MPISHAWIVPADDGRIYEPVRDRYFTASEYESKFHDVIVERTYTEQQVLPMFLNNNHFGP